MNGNTPCQKKLIKGWIFSCYIFCNFWTKVLWFFSSFTCNQIVYYKELLFMWATYGLDLFLIKKKESWMNWRTLQRTYDFAVHFQGFKPPDEGPSEYQSIPLNKIEDFGVHCKQWVDPWWQESLNLEFKVKIIKALKYIKNSCGSIIMYNKDYVFRQ